MNKTFSVRHVNFAYHTMQGETPALSDITFDVCDGEFLGIVGPSGCGKSTLLNLLCGLLAPESGSILLNGKPLDEKSRLRIGYMLQQDYLLEWRSVLKNILLGLEIRGELTPESQAYARELLKQYGLERFADAKPGQLSGGMRQRTALVRTLVLKPDLLLLDEPFSALDYQTRLAVGNDIGSIIRKQQKTAVLVTHDLSEAVSLADRILILSSRPGSIRSIVTVEMPSGLTPLERRNHPSFKDYFQKIWDELHVTETSGKSAAEPPAGNNSSCSQQESE
ncbi:MAG: ABC transporter ATP-binding protein [Lachnospiraceae bacterium]|nr:ABC transporter ATP-binding protein [Lachnospiraceae bacterium]